MSEPTQRMHALALERVQTLIGLGKLGESLYVQNAMAYAINDYVETYYYSARSEPIVNDLGDALFFVGNHVEKSVGDARYTGHVVAVYSTRAGKIRYVVEVEPQGFQMICSAAMLRLLPSPTTQTNRNGDST